MESLFGRLQTALRSADATIAALFVYGDVTARDDALPLLRRHVGPIDWPILWVEGRSCDGRAIAGLQAFVVRGQEVERVLVKGRVVGTSYSDGQMRHCLLAGIGPDDPRSPREQQAQQTFENLSSALETARFRYGDIARTWFYNHRLLEWYGEFNRVRTRFYAGQAFRCGGLPASTGVEANNVHGAALAVAAWAVQPLDSRASVREIASPLQCAAMRYGSAFSRAVEIESCGGRRLLISGTASIAPDGRSLWPGDVTNQIATTMEVVRAILDSRGMSFADVARATAYVKYPLDAAAFTQWQRARRVRLPAVLVHCDICRDDLLFEIEVDARK